MCDRGCNTATQYHALQPRSLGGCYENEPCFLTHFFLGYHVTSGLAFQGPGQCSGWWHGAQDKFPAISVCFHHCEHMALALVGLWEHDIINLPGLPMFIFQPSSSISKRLYPLGLLDCSHLSHSWITCAIVSMVKFTPCS